MAEQNLSVDIKIKADTAGAKQATAAIDGVDKAVADLSKTEKEATNINGMYLDSLGRIHDASGKFVKVSAEERAGLKERIKLQQQDTVTTTGAVQAKKELGKSNSNAAMGVLALSNALQDAQYGMAGMINNIPMMVSGLGLGMGVAGAVQAAAVGIQILTKNVDLFGEKAKQAARDAAELTTETMADANAAYKAAAATKTMTEAQERHNEVMRETEERYKQLIKLSEDFIKQKQAERDAETALADAEAGMEMARIQLAEARGEMTKEEAIFAKEKVRTEADARKQTAAIALEEAKVAEARKKAAAEDAQAQEKRGMALQLQGEGAGIMTKDDKKLAEENKKLAQSQLEEARFKQEEAAKTVAHLTGLQSNPMAAMGVYEGLDIEKSLKESKAEMAKQNEEAAKLQADINREDAKLKKDKEARDRTGLKDGDRRDLDKAIQAQFGEAKAGEARAGELRGEAAAGEAGIVRSRQLFGMRQATGAMSALAQVEAERAKQREETARAREKAGYDMDFMGPIPTGDYLDSQKRAKDRAREAKQVGTAGGSLASTLAGDGLAPGFADSLRAAAGGAGDAAGLDRLIAMVAKLAANSSKLSEQAKSKLDKLEAEIEDLRTAK
jgi:hypothetical protein